MKNSGPGSFNLPGRLLHWILALAIVAMLFIGAGMMTSIILRPALLNLHRPLGFMIFILVIIRIVNRLMFRTPKLPASVPRWQVAAAHFSHVMLYMLMVSMPLLGWAMMSAGNWPVSLMGGWVLPPLIPENPVHYAWLRTAHTVCAWVLFLCVTGHICAALIHAWIYRDGVFSSMVKNTRGS